MKPLYDADWVMWFTVGLTVILVCMAVLL